MENKLFFVTLLDGFFYFFGLTSNPVSSKVDKILKDSSAKKMKNDIANLRKDYKSTFVNFKQNFNLN